MPQFDVHRNVGRAQDVAPYLLVVQSSLFNRSASRVVVPLFRADLFRQPDPGFHVRLHVQGASVVMDPLQIFAIPAARLTPPVANIEDQGDAISAALDLLLSRAYR